MDNERYTLNPMELTSIRRLLTQYRDLVMERLDWPENQLELTQSKLTLKDIDMLVDRIHEMIAAQRFGAKDNGVEILK